jgi:outer membrane lipoprotein-sorting protein
MKPFLIVSVLMMSAGSAGADPTAQELLARYDAAMGPPQFECVVVMTAHREDDSTRSYRMRMLKSGSDRTRVWFLEPAASRGQEILRQGENLWIYMPSLKRAIRMANRDSFQGGDFNNADVLRVNYARDYSAQVVPDAAAAGAWLIDLRARTEDASYDRIKLWLGRKDGLPLKGEYYSASGKLLRTAEFSDVRDFGGLRRPTRIQMKNAIAVKRHSEMVVESLDTRVSPPSGRFVLDDLGR